MDQCAAKKSSQISIFFLEESYKGVKVSFLVIPELLQPNEVKSVSCGIWEYL